jgi:transposase
MWIPPEETDPVVLHAPTRRSLALFGAVNLRTGKLVTMFSPEFDTDTSVAFLRLLRRHASPRRQTVIIIDNAAYHHGAERDPLFRSLSPSLRLDFLPPYSPDLNPIERVWKLLRHLATHNRYFPEFDQLVDAVTERIIAWGKPNRILRSLCCII